MKNHSIRWITVLGVITIIGIFLLQMHWLKKAFDVQNRQFSHTVQVALTKVSETLQEQQSELESPLQNVQELSSSFFIVGVNGAIDTNLLTKTIQKEFGVRNVSADIEYAIYDSSSHRMIYGNTLSENLVKKNLKLRVIKNGDYYLGVFFPQKLSVIAEAVDVWVFSTFLLLLMVTFFGYALFMILKQKRLSEIQKDFVNNMTHEFKTPLSTIALSAQTLYKHNSINSNKDLKFITEIISKETEKLDLQMERILQMAKSDRSNIKLLKENINLHELITELIHQTNATNQKQITIVGMLEAEQPIVLADKLHFKNVVLNLIDNAVKYSPSGSTIKIKTQGHESALQLSIEDQGGGIAAIYHKKIFEPFFRVPTGNIHNVRGFGLGLSYVKNIIRAHQWKIDFVSEDLAGTKFIINFRQNGLALPITKFASRFIKTV